MTLITNAWRLGPVSFVKLPAVFLSQTLISLDQHSRGHSCGWDKSVRGASLASYDIWYNFINLCTLEIITGYVKKFRIEFCSVERSSWIFELSKHFLERIVYLVDTFYNLAKLQHCYSDTSQHRKIFARSEYKSIAQTALYECSRFVVGGGGDHRTCAPRGSPPENKWDSIEDLIIRLRWKGRLGQNDAEAVEGGDLLIVQWNIFV